MKKTNNPLLKKEIKRVLILLLEEFIKEQEKRKIIAKIIYEYVSQTISKHEKTLPNEFKESLKGFLDFNHWGDEELKPAYSINEVKIILKGFKKGLS
jgi:hypothetical protein